MKTQSVKRVASICGAGLIAILSPIACGQISTQVPIDAGADVGMLEGKTYDGYVLGKTWTSGSNRIRITFAAATDGTVYGNVVFGDDPLLSPPSDPTVGYPPGLMGDVQAGLDGPVEHFAFSILSGVQQGSRVTFGIDTQQLWKSWCELQTTDYNGSCLPPGTTNLCPGADAGSGSCCLFPPDGGAIPMDCEYIQLCSWGGPCSCSSSGCSVDMNPNVSFDLQLSGNAVDGAIVNLGATIHATVAP